MKLAINPNWKPGAETLRWATDAIKTYNLATDLDFEVDFFRDYYLQKKEAKSDDWDATFRTWVGRDIKEAIKQKVKSPAAIQEAQKYAGIQRVPDAPANSHD